MMTSILNGWQQEFSKNIAGRQKFTEFTSKAFTLSLKELGPFTRLEICKSNLKVFPSTWGGAYGSESSLPRDISSGISPYYQSIC